jgi:hypothetical protein
MGETELSVSDSLNSYNKDSFASVNMSSMVLENNKWKKL